MSTQIHMIGNAHLDPVWLWRWPEGYQEVKATFQSALDRLEGNEGFIFTCACADYYRLVEENAPEMFEAIRRRVREGRWAVVGGMWIQPDMNIPSGESLARQLLYSQRYFREKLGVTARTGYNVDTFGHNAVTPQLLRAAGIENYVWMRPQLHENAALPEGAMVWRGPDGSEVLAYRIPYEYLRAHDQPGKLEQSLAFSDRLHQPMMCFYGVGNHGGGPTIENLREIDQYIREAPRGKEVAYSSPDAFFDQLRREDVPLPAWEGELQHHASGCYSTHSVSKKLMREAENALLRAEKLGAMAQQLTGHRMNHAALRQGWSNVLFNQFHDVMGGCSLRTAMEDAITQLSESISIARREEVMALLKMSWAVDTQKGHPLRVRSKEDHFFLWGVHGQGTPVVAFNPHPFEVQGAVVIRSAMNRITDREGAVLPHQIIRAARTNGADKWDTLFRVTLPPMGYSLFWVFPDGEPAELPESGLFVDESTLSNRHLCARFDPLTGAMISLVRRDTGREYLAAPARPMLADVEHCDTWAHNIFRFDKPAGVFSGAQIKVEETGPVRAVLRVVTRFGSSCLTQRYVLYADSDQLEVETVVDFHEKHHMLKLSFPTVFSDGRQLSEIAYGSIARPMNGEEETHQRWTAAQGERAALCLLNDGRYSHSCERGEVRLTIAHSAIFADHYGQQHRDDFCEYMDQGELRLKYVIYPFEGDDPVPECMRRGAALNQEPVSVTETYHEGSLPERYAGMQPLPANVELGAMKPAEDGNGWILRLREMTGQETEFTLSLPLMSLNAEVRLAPHEICTLRIQGQSASKIMLTEF